MGDAVGMRVFILLCDNSPVWGSVHGTGLVTICKSTSRLRSFLHSMRCRIALSLACQSLVDQFHAMRPPATAADAASSNWLTMHMYASLIGVVH